MDNPKYFWRARVWEKRKTLELLAEGHRGRGFGKESDGGVDAEAESGAEVLEEAGVP